MEAIPLELQPAPSGDGRRLLLAAAISMALHGGVLAAFSAAPPPTAPMGEAIDVEILVDAAAPAATPDDAQSQARPPETAEPVPADAAAAKPQDVAALAEPPPPPFMTQPETAPPALAPPASPLALPEPAQDADAGRQQDEAREEARQRDRREAQEEAQQAARRKKEQLARRQALLEAQEARQQAQEEAQEARQQAARAAARIHARREAERAQAAREARQADAERREAKQADAERREARQADAERRQVQEARRHAALQPSADTGGGGGAPARASGADIGAFRSAVAARVAAMKRYPAGARGRGETGRPVVAFSVSPAGGLGGVSLARSSGHGELDSEALSMVRRAAPFPRPPAGAPRSFSIGVSFDLR